MLIRDFYQGKIITALEGSSIKDVASTMALQGVGYLVITKSTDGCTPIGIITDRDLVVKGLAQGLNGDASVELIMTEKIITIESNQTITEALDLMKNNNVRRILVLDHAGHAWSVVSIDDLLWHLSKQIEKVGSLFHSQDGTQLREHTHEFTRMA